MGCVTIAIILALSVSYFSEIKFARECRLTCLGLPVLT